MNDELANLPSLPSGWVWVTLADLAENEPNSITDGPFGSNLKTAHYTSAGPRVIRLQNIAPAKFIDEKAHISEDHFQGLKKHEVHPGDIVIASLGKPLPRACLVPDWVGRAIVKADCIRLKTAQGVADAKYVMYALNTPGTQKRAETIVHGVGRPRLNLGDIRATAVPLAPFSEQQRIVLAIDKYMSQIDEALQLLQHVQAQLKRYCQSVLKSAVEGKLTAEWREKHKGVIEPAEHLLKRILVERRAKWEEQELAKMKAKGQHPKDDTWKKKYKEPEPPNTEGLPELPEGWTWTSVGQMSYVVRGASPRPAGNPKYFGGMIPWITVGEITKDAQMYLKNVASFVTEAGKRKSRYIEEGTLLLTNSGATLGVPKITAIGGCINDGSVAMLGLYAITKKYLYYLLMSKTESLRRINQGAAQPNLNTSIVSDILVPLPPLREQVQIVEKVETKISVAHNLEGLAAQNINKVRRLKQATLLKAFSGSLVPQDPTDEPASVLLERIKAEREKSKTAREKAKPQKRRSNTEKKTRKEAVQTILPLNK